MLYFCMGVLGAIIGSFINVVSMRLGKGEDFIYGRSCCPHCRHTLRAVDLIPLVSFLCLKGKCRYCKKRISIRYFLVEVLFSLIFILVASLKGPTEWIGYFFCCVCILIALMDIDSYEVDLRLLILLWGVGLIQRVEVIESSFISMTIGFMFYMIIYFGGKWIWKEEVFGMGDVYYLTALGAYFSVNQVLYIGLLSFVIGGCVALVWLFFARKTVLHAKIPFTPFISISALWTYLFSIQWILI